LTLTPALPKPDGSAPDDVSVSTYNFSILPPGQALPIQPVMALAVHEKVFSVKVTWSQIPSADNCEKLEYEFEPKDGFMGGWKTKGVHHIAEELEKICKKMPSN
jgi:hypothetical protein